MALTYKEALAESKRKKSAASDEAQLAAMVKIVHHPGHNPEMVYRGALMNRKTWRDVGKMSDEELTELMYEGMGI